MAKPTNKNVIIRDLLAQFPKVSKKGLAEKAAHDYPMIFTIEQARSIIRNVTNANGERHRSFNKVGGVVQREAFKLPTSKCSERKFVRINENHILWMSDIHIPNQNNAAIELAIEEGLREKVNCIILGGDIMDNTPFTSHDAPPPSPDEPPS